MKCTRQRLSMSLAILALSAATISGCNMTTDFEALYDETSVCTGHWRGVDCEVCPGNWDPTADCNACRTHWTGADCDICTGNWDAGEDCNACQNSWTGDDCEVCPTGWNALAECNSCANEWSGLACEVCSGNWDATADCGTCRNQWSGASCETCSGGWEPTADCGACRNQWSGDDCDLCLGNWDTNADCGACRNQWSGSDCETCSGNWDQAADCNACQNQWSGTSCETCPGNWDAGGNCMSCAEGWIDNSNECGTCVRYVRSDGSPSGNALTWGTAINSVQGAIVSARQAITGSSAVASCQIWVQTGSYAPTYGTGEQATFLLGEGVELYGGFSPSALTWQQRDPQTHMTTLDGGGANHVVTGANNSILDGFTVRGGVAYGTASTAINGAGLNLTSGNMTVSKTSFVGNLAKASGGGAYVGSSASIVFDGCNFSSNTTEGRGGAIFAKAGAVVDVIDSVFTTNEARHGGGAGDAGAIYAGVGVVLTVQGSIFDGNTTVGGGGAIQGSAATLSISTSQFLSNSVLSAGSGSGGGGAIHVSDGTLTVSRSEFLGNAANNSIFGGALHIGALANVELTNSIFMDNRTSGSWPIPEGGAIYMNGANLTVMNCTLYANAAAGGGGPPPPTGGGIYMNTASMSIDMTNSIVWGNTPQGVTDVDGTLSNFATFSLLQDTADNPIFNNIKVDPLFIGGDPYSLKLNVSSQCINHGELTGAPADDFDGFARAGQPDLGAYEYH